MTTQVDLQRSFDEIDDDGDHVDYPQPRDLSDDNSTDK